MLERGLLKKSKSFSPKVIKFEKLADVFIKKVLRVNQEEFFVKELDL